MLEGIQSESINLSSLGYSEQELEALLIPEEELDWTIFDQEQAEKQTRNYVFLAVKIKCNVKHEIKESIINYAKEHSIPGKDFPILAGDVLTHLLGLHR